MLTIRPQNLGKGDPKSQNSSYRQVTHTTEIPQSIATIPLAEFLARDNIKSSPAWEFMDGQAVQKPIPTLFHLHLELTVDSVMAMTRI